MHPVHPDLHLELMRCHQASIRQQIIEQQLYPRNQSSALRAVHKQLVSIGRLLQKWLGRKPIAVSKKMPALIQGKV